MGNGFKLQNPVGMVIHVFLPSCNGIEWRASAFDILILSTALDIMGLNDLWVCGPLAAFISTGNSFLVAVSKDFKTQALTIWQNRDVLQSPGTLASAPSFSH